jgi:hypothetical protein
VKKAYSEQKMSGVGMYLDYIKVKLEEISESKIKESFIGLVEKINKKNLENTFSS